MINYLDGILAYIAVVTNLENVKYNEVLWIGGERMVSSILVDPSHKGN